jgi:hypothetical protein
MVALENHVGTILEFVKKAQREGILFEEIFDDPTVPTGKNEFLFFIKPELTLESESIKLEQILQLIQEKIRAFGFRVHNIKILSAKYLENYDIIAQHYGVINRIAANAIQNMSDSAKEKFKNIYGKSVDECRVAGGLEILDSFPAFNAYSLDYLWQNLENNKLAGGTYCEVIKIDNEVIYLINGFHPRQLKHFTEAGRSIVVFTLSGDLPWSEARGNFIGATNPTSANKGSLRRELLDRRDQFGLPEVSQGVNGVHLSAGPVEALIELRRYNSNFADSSKVKGFTSYSMGRKLEENFPDDVVEQILSNVNVEVDGKAISIFDLTEEKDSDEAIAILKQYF